MPDLPEVGGSAGASQTPHAPPGSWGKKYPKLTDWMTTSYWPDGRPRVGCRIIISAMFGAWRVTLKEPNLGLELEVTSDNPEELLAALDAVLAKPNVPWRVDPWSKNGGQGKKKR